MQSNKNISIDARSFQEIWNSLSLGEQAELRFKLCRDLDLTRQTVWNWTKGKYPILRSVMVAAAKVVNRELGIKASHVTLFPR